MTTTPRKPLSNDEVAFLVQLANGNALFLQRRREQARAHRPPPSPGQ
ncbi:hypothetical protein LPL18_001320 [Halomonas sp. CUBES01]|uniref:Uncharacterized protein n=1 Tax=Vreelandella gomseomensis TaxID=370766 RepID=A0ABU1GCD6_9GAMM|nr:MULTISPECIES: hypothetical protein [Halomonas]MDR5875151.1 hypothetical protein [Halomonas gomseomensis]MEC4765986.1 hypothetical protein [Halomonas sp. CUBES01]